MPRSLGKHTTSPVFTSRQLGPASNTSPSLQAYVLTLIGTHTPFFRISVPSSLQSTYLTRMISSRTVVNSYPNRLKFSLEAYLSSCTAPLTLSSSLTWAWCTMSVFDVLIIRFNLSFREFKPLGHQFDIINFLFVWFWFLFLDIIYTPSVDTW